MVIYVVALIAFIVAIFVLVNKENSSPNVFVAFADDSEAKNERDYYSGLVVMDENVQDDEFKVLISGRGLENAGLLNGEFYIFKELNCSNEKKLDYISVGKIVLIDFPEIRLRQVFEVVGVNDDDGLLSLAWYGDDDEKKKIFKYYPKPVIGIMQ